MKPWIKITLGLLLAAFVIAFIVVWDVYLRDQIDSVEVVVVKPGLIIDSHQPIDESMLVIEQRERASIIPNVITPKDMNQIIGLEPKYPLIGNMMVSKHYIDFEKLIPDPNKKESYYPIPDEWIYVLPSTLRRNDKIDIYMLQGNKGQQEQTNQNSRLTLAQMNQLASSDKLSEARKQQLKDLGAIPALMNIPIVYAKDSNGNEIANAKGSENGQLKPSNEKRYYSTGVVTNLELLLNEEQYRTILTGVQDGYKLYITYN